MASGRLQTDGKQEENDVMFSLQTMRAIYLTKTKLFQLNCKLQYILMPLQVESDSCGIFSCEETSWKNFAFMSFNVKKTFYCHFLTTTFFHLATEKIISRKLISDPDMYQSIQKFNISGPPGQLSGNFVV